MSAKYAIVDIFAGPGGLAEGFSQVTTSDGHHPFKVVLSIEKEATAHATLLLRTFLRQFEGGLPDEYYAFLNGESEEPAWATLFPAQWAAAEKEALQLELGGGNADETAELTSRLDQIRDEHNGDVILIGGPPCQAYSIAGRGRNSGNEDYDPKLDGRHFLYQEYIRILSRLKPAAFVMENVKGMLSASVDGEDIFERVLADLRNGGGPGNGYKLLALAADETRADLFDNQVHRADFIIKAEDFGVPQARHRVIVVGIRADLAARIEAAGQLRLVPPEGGRSTVRHVLGGLLGLRSGLTEQADSRNGWRETLLDVAAQVAELKTALPKDQAIKFVAHALNCADKLGVAGRKLNRTGGPPAVGPDCPQALVNWILDPRLTALPNHHTRSHMRSDLKRYFFATVFGEAIERSPRAVDFPKSLAPDHKSWTSGKYVDRFRVQLWDHPSATITSHISKDGHYFIHPDPIQCRALTVREAARLQTFPDNYFFRGNRTQQYVQVGNAVPPLLARQIGEVLRSILVDEQPAIVVEREELADVA